MNKLNNLLSYLKRDKKRFIIILAALVCAALMLLSLNSGGNNESSDGLESYREDLEGEIASLCKTIDGVGRCRVKVTFSEGESRQYRSSTLISSSPPKVLGVAVVCDGGGNDEVRRAVVDCMTSLFDIGSNRVCVLQMKK